ncbi:MAG: hypothetical protein Q9Q40_10645 [Acidobacteriota bacterium]|nr:hypothetical protein [Acidobacteriota bacterium]
MTIRHPALAAAQFFLLLAAAVPLGWAAEEATVRLESEAAGGGTLGVYLQWPATAAEDRYLDGPPVVVAMHGGARPGSISDWSELADGAGFVVVQFVYPGGEDQGVASDGVYDYRGPVCALAARDVWLFALGLKTDDQGRSIEEIVGRPVLTALMGVEATSNGTMITPVVLDTYAADFVGRVRHVSLWENIGTDQVRTVEMGRAAYDCNPALDGDGNGLPDDDGKNPRYDPVRDYAYDEVSLDYSSLAWDPNLKQVINDAGGRFPSATRDGVLFFDGNGNGRLDHQPLQRGCTDVDGNGRVDLYEDWLIGNPISTFEDSGQPRVYYSRAVTRYLEAHAGEIFPDGWPDWVATAAQAEAFHPPRTAGDHYHRLGPYRRSLRTLTSFDAVPHFYTTADHLEAQVEQDGLAQAELWRRLQADLAYFEAWNGPAPVGYPDAPANLDVPVGEMALYAVPGTDSRNQLVIPALMELADRTYYGGWGEQLDAILDGGSLPVSEVEGLLLPSAERITWDPASGNLFYDVARGDVADLMETSGVVDLGPLVCIEEDSADTEALDPALPPPATAWFYLVRPGALAGTYGAASDGAPREAGDEGCLH